MALTKQRKQKRPRNPMEATGELVHEENAPELPPLVDLDTMPDDLIHNREIAHVRAAVYSFQWFLVCLCGRHRIPLDNALNAIELLVLWVECELVARVMEPECYAVEGDDDELPTEQQAYADHLTITERPKKRKRLHAINPGCQGHIIDGIKCVKLRVKGQRFCPSCEKRYLAMIRGEHQ